MEVLPRKNSIKQGNKADQSKEQFNEKQKRLPAGTKSTRRGSRPHDNKALYC